jgi:hypothetical protein
VIDFGLFWTVVVVTAACWLFSRVMSPVTMERNALLDRVWLPLAAGVVVGRFASLAFDGALPTTSIGTFVLLRNGTSFWPGLVAAAVAAVWSARRDVVDIWYRLSDLACLGLVAYGAYEMSCVLRDGCFGPESLLGLVPPGMSNPVVPVGLLVGAGTVVAGVMLRRWWMLRPWTTVLVSLWVVSALRWVAWFGLPRVPGDSVRLQVANTVVMVISGALIVVLWVTERLRARRLEADLSGVPERGEP